MNKSPFYSMFSVVTLSFVATSLIYACSPILQPGETTSNPSLNKVGTPDTELRSIKPFCYGSEISICSFPAQYELSKAVDILQYAVESHNLQIPAKKATWESPYVGCAEIAYPGTEKAIQEESHMRGTFVCLFNSKYAMNMALNRISTFVEDFRTVDSEPGYLDEKWAKAQKSEGTLGHNLESPDIRRYLAETDAFIAKRAAKAKKDPGTALEAEFLNQYIIPKIDPVHGKPESIFLGVYIPSKKPSPSTGEKLKAVLGHEIFHGLFFHSEKMRNIVGEFVTKLSEEEKALIEKRLSQKGYAVIPEAGEVKTPKQEYMLLNEAQAYLLESGSCRDGAFVSYFDEGAEYPSKIVPNTAPLVVTHAETLRERLIKEGVFTREWAAHWSPDVAELGCKANFP